MPINENARPLCRRASSLKNSPSKAVLDSKPSRRRHVKAEHNETRRNAASCYRTKNVKEPQFGGLMVIESDLSAGAKCWVNIGARHIKSGPRIGQTYLSVTIYPAEPREGRAA